MKRSLVALVVLLAACSGQDPGAGGAGGAGTGGGQAGAGPAGTGPAGGAAGTGEAGGGPAGTTGGGGAGTTGGGGAGTTGGGGAGTTGGGGAGTSGASDGGAAGGGTAGSGTTGAAGRDGGATTDGPAGVDAPKLTECTMPSIDRIQSWNATQGEGDMVPSGGSLLVKEGDHYVAKVMLNGSGWHVLPVYLSNAAGGGMVDLSTSTGFTLTYSTTADLWIQMRPANHWNGGVQWVTKIPSSGGMMVSRFFSLDAASWSYLSQLGGKPSWPYEEARAQVRGFVFVGNATNTVVFAGLRFDGYTPVCRP
jgi:hypothetical protein